MRYQHKELEFSFNLPDNWHCDESNVTLTFFGPNGRVGSLSEVIQLKIGKVNSQYCTPESREKLLAEPGSPVIRRKIGDEENVVVLQGKNNGEISAVHDGIHYNFTFSKDAVTLRAIDLICESFRFPSPEQAAAALRAWANPNAQTIGKLLRVNSTKEAEQILSDAGMVRTVGRSGASIYRESNKGGNLRQVGTRHKRWWQLWK